ncbi:MAG: hypothetical protein KJO16_03530 [Muriicola sp.]|nr:hypothetical protein [Muriicola sp.]MBT8283468.1 hypothetical protein [Muriicola sp.]NNK10816.1 hypothetical protein [Flavobacteriaceae bacterium]
MRPNRQYIILLLFLLGISVYAEAQVGAMGRRRITPQTQTPPEKAEPMTAEELVEAEMPKLLESIEFSEFEQAILKSILTKYVQQRIEIQILKLSPEKTREAYEQINLSQDEELKASLPEDKYEALKAYRERGGKKAKSKKRKKKKNKS